MQLNAVVSTQVRAFTFKLVYQNKIFSFFSQATFKGWTDIMYAAVDSRDVSRLIICELTKIGVQQSLMSNIIQSIILNLKSTCNGALLSSVQEQVQSHIFKCVCDNKQKIEHPPQRIKVHGFTKLQAIPSYLFGSFFHKFS